MTFVRALLGLCCVTVLALSACGPGGGNTPASPAYPQATAAPVVPAAATPNPAKTAMPSNDPYGYGY